MCGFTSHGAMDAVRSLQWARSRYELRKPATVQRFRGVYILQQSENLMKNTIV